jgi:hypothetical protein
MAARLCGDQRIRGAARRVRHGALKFWLAISAEEQLRRFKDREVTAYKQYKITEEDWRNRGKWGAYEAAACDMIKRTNTSNAPWILVEANDKTFARLKVLDAVCDRLKNALSLVQQFRPQVKFQPGGPRISLPRNNRQRAFAELKRDAETARQPAHVGIVAGQQDQFLFQGAAAALHRGQDFPAIAARRKQFQALQGGWGFPGAQKFFRGFTGSRQRAGEGVGRFQPELPRQFTHRPRLAMA